MRTDRVPAGRGPGFSRLATSAPAPEVGAGRECRRAASPPSDRARRPGTGRASASTRTGTAVACSRIAWQKPDTKKQASPPGSASMKRRERPSTEKASAPEPADRRPKSALSRRRTRLRARAYSEPPGQPRAATRAGRRRRPACARSRRSPRASGRRMTRRNRSRTSASVRRSRRRTSVAVGADLALHHVAQTQAARHRDAWDSRPPGSRRGWSWSRMTSRRRSATTAWTRRRAVVRWRERVGGSGVASTGLGRGPGAAVTVTRRSSGAPRTEATQGQPTRFRKRAD